MLEARAISVRVGQCPIIEGVSLQLKAGELVGLLGPNGAGKSTCLRALASVLAHEGEILLAGRLARTIPLRERARLLAYLPQARQIDWAITAREVVALGRHPFQRRFARLSAEDEAAIDAAMAEAGVAGLATRSARVLSGGEMARVLLARALAVRAPILLADEPVAALDPFHQLAVMETLRARARAGAAVLVVLHDLTLAARFLDRAIVMHRGRIAAEGDARAVLAPPLLEQVYNITPLAGEHGGEGWLVPWQRKPLGSSSESAA